MWHKRVAGIDAGSSGEDLGEKLSEQNSLDLFHSNECGSYARWNR